VVVVLAALGYWLIAPKAAHRGQAAAPATSSAPAQPPAAAQPPSAQSASAAPQPASPAAASGVNIYSWLPFTEQDLAHAASVTVKFCVAYDTFRYTDSADAYVGRMNGLITGQLASTLRAAYSVPGVAKLRTGQKQVSTGSAVINSLRAFGPSSLTFVVTLTQHLASSQGTSNGSTRYAVTVTSSGAAWQVNDIQLASAGNS
jgi:3-oxoacyl-ACP reductase-like protein